MNIKNIVFDVGNVLVHYDPAAIIKQCFPEENEQKQALLVQSIFKQQTWYDLNLGLITEAQAIQRYHNELGIEIAQLRHLVETVKVSLTPLDGINLLQTLHSNDYPLYALTDNTLEIMAYLKKRYDFWPLLQGVVVSADIGYLKPAKEIYQQLLTEYDLVPAQTLFIDDMPKNVEGAIACGLQAIQYLNVDQCIAELRSRGVRV
jgi:putative hydrolase of the HAD superfamily